VAAALRGIGFVGMLAGAQNPAALAVPYVALIATLILGYWGIARGLIIEPPAFVVRAINAIIEGYQRRTAALSGATP